ncbi:MAG: prephenate dehydrogenase [Candidatus Dormibacteria bacterium]
MSPLGRVAIVGTGQIGTTIGQALMAADPGYGVDEVGLFDREPQTAADSMALGGGDRILATPDLVLQADTVILAVPVGGIVDWVGEWGWRLQPGCLLLDTGSSKGVVVAAMRDGISASVAAVGGHPICGTESPGPAAPRRVLLAGARGVLHPGPPPPEARGRAPGLVECLGAVPVSMEADLHDRVVARSSHLPHLLAGALAQLCSRARDDDGADVSLLLGPGFLGATRLAAAEPEMVASFVAANASAVAAALRELGAELLRLGDMVSGDPADLVEFLEAGAGARRQLLGEPR